MTKEDVEDASGEREQECWFGEGGCLESSKMESRSWRDCCYSGVHLATPVYEDKPGSKLDDDELSSIRTLVVVCWLLPTVYCTISDNGDKLSISDNGDKLSVSDNGDKLSEIGRASCRERV